LANAAFQGQRHFSKHLTEALPSRKRLTQRGCCLMVVHDPFSDMAEETTARQAFGLESRFSVYCAGFQLQYENIRRNTSSIGNGFPAHCEVVSCPKIITFPRSTIKIVHSVCGARSLKRSAEILASFNVKLQQRTVACYRPNRIERVYEI